jgi:2,5-diketo-D-gluconate reductase A
MKCIPKISLNDGRSIPQFGLGVWRVSNSQAIATIHQALNAGYRSIDTAAAYENEEGVGEAVRTALVPRSELFVTTKLWNNRHGTEGALRGIDESLKRLKLDYVDLYLIHWPVPQLDAYVETWRALAKIKQQGLAKSIGVCNFNVPHLQRLIDETGVVPVLNQIELHPYLQQKTLREFHAKHQIVTECWSPLAQGVMVQDSVVVDLARKYNKTPAQIILRWHIQNGFVVIPKSVTPGRIRENIQVFDFQLELVDLQKIQAMECHQRVGPDPDTFALGADVRPKRDVV